MQVFSESRVRRSVRRVSELDSGRTHRDLFASVGIEASIRAEILTLPPGHPYLRLPIQMTAGLAPRLKDFVSAEELARLQGVAESELREPAAGALRSL